MTSTAGKAERRALRCLGLLASGWLVACQMSREEPPSLPRTAAPRAAHASALLPPGVSRLRIGRWRTEGAPAIEATHGALGGLLAQRLSVPVELVETEGALDAAAWLLQGGADLIQLDAATYAEASGPVSLRCLVQSVAEGSTTAASYVFVRDDSPRQRVSDLKGARLGLVARDSRFGALYPMKVLRDRGLPAEAFASIDFLGSASAVARAVLEGRVDVGAAHQNVLRPLGGGAGYDALGLRVIAKTARVPLDAWCVREAWPTAAVVAVSNALLALRPWVRADRAALAPLGVEGFLPHDARAFDGAQAPTALAFDLPMADDATDATDATDAGLER